MSKLELPYNWYATPESRERYRPVLRAWNDEHRQRRETTRKLLAQALATLTPEEAAVAREGIWL